MTIGTRLKKPCRERGKTAPDISQLPHPAQIFDASADEILGIYMHR